MLITCHVSISNFDKVFIHWYRKRPGTAPKRIAYMATRLFLENESDKGKFSIEKDIAKSECTLTVGRVTAQDAATYYCARWDAQQQRAIGNLHKDMICFRNQTLECQKTCGNDLTYSLCIFIQSKNNVGFKMFAFLVLFAPDCTVPLLCCFLTASPAVCAGPPSGWPIVSHILPSGTAPVPATELGAFFGAEVSRHPEKNAAAANAGPG